jgi:hypothetical protein
MGEPGYLYNLPEPVSFTVYVNINALEIVEPDLQNLIAQSITNWFEDYRIGERIEYSDIRNCIVIAYAAGSDHEFLGTERPFRGINSLTCTVVGRGESISQDGQTIDLEEDEIAKLASVEVQINWEQAERRLVNPPFPRINDILQEKRVDPAGKGSCPMPIQLCKLL